MIHYKPDIYIKDVFNKPYGLNYLPTLEPNISDNCDCFKNYRSFRDGESDNSLKVLELVTEVVQKAPMNILEIGVSLYDREWTMSNRLTGYKDYNSKYVGIDTQNREHVKNWGTNSYFYQINSREFDIVKCRLNQLLGIYSLGLLVIDGDHSLNGILADWKYVELLDKKGYILIHDSNTHPGPIALIEAIDRKIFNVEEPLKNNEDHGIALISYKDK